MDAASALIDRTELSATFGCTLVIDLSNATLNVELPTGENILSCVPYRRTNMVVDSPERFYCTSYLKSHIKRQKVPCESLYVSCGLIECFI
jgi:hypothetical protein